MDSMDSRQPQDEQHCPNAPPEAAALGEQVSSAGAQSHVPPLQSPCCPPGPSSAQDTAPTLSGPGSGLEAPEPGEGSWSSEEEEEEEVCHPLQPCPGGNYMERELSQGEVSRTPTPSQGESSSSRTSPQENRRRITIRTVWVNPDYPELLRNRLQEGATPSASEEQLPAAGTRSAGPASPCCSACSSRTQLAAQTFGELRAVHRRPSRRALQALCTLLWCSCMELRLDG